MNARVRPSGERIAAAPSPTFPGRAPPLESSTLRRTTPGMGEGVWVARNAQVAARARPRSAATDQGRKIPRRAALAATGVAPVSSAAAAGTLSSAIRASPTSRRRCFGSLTRQRCRSWVSAGPVSEGSAPQSGSARSTAASVSEIVSPANNGRPVSISRRTQPNAQTSLRVSAARPFACSGLM